MNIYVDELKHENMQYVGNTLMFIDDLPDGGCLCECGFCGKETSTKNENSVCDCCGKDLVYNLKYSW